ncbi:LysE/ArgO family amino acid transporter [Allorhizobium sp. BGMRC 0089]|uniref:LysE/ArgO family amino acid transporter n=1 Tax=Allorhizobium sonneratiae TaxID=2934936 RepID=UPI002033C5D4|nr:LysE/ArgO family amino acid transporter [Allorhizobium sonneratiae]MCM2292914.1 LysE/ArgO family amino acid transporter [Allorhizobium sonneratiae]
MSAFLPGLFLGLSLIVAIGAQNAFVLRQGLQRHHVFAVCLVCALSDAVLVMAGISGFGALVTALPKLELVMTLAGAAFLFVYGLKSLWAAYKATSGLDPAAREAGSLTKTLATCLAFTWLNPHVYLDTVVLLGSVSTHYGENRFIFGLGSITASFAFFFALGYGARLLAPVFARPVAWRVLDLIIGVIMIALSIKLL